MRNVQRATLVHPVLEHRFVCEGEGIATEIECPCRRFTRQEAEAKECGGENRFQRRGDVRIKVLPMVGVEERILARLSSGLAVLSSNERYSVRTVGAG